MKSVPLPRIGMRVVKTAVAVMLSYTIFVPFGLIYNEALGGVWGQLGPLYACIACIICTQSTLGQTIQQGLSRLSAWRWAEPWVPPPCCWRRPGRSLGTHTRPGGGVLWRGVDLPAAQAAHRLRHGVHPALRHSHHRRHRRDRYYYAARPHH